MQQPNPTATSCWIWSSRPLTSSGSEQKYSQMTYIIMYLYLEKIKDFSMGLHGQCVTMCRVVKNNINMLRIHESQAKESCLKSSWQGLNSISLWVCVQYVKGNVTVSAKRKRKLAQYKNILRKLVRKGESFKVKKKFLIQKDGGGVLLPILLSTELQAKLC